MQLINKVFLTVAIMATIVVAAPACSHEEHQHGSRNFPRVSPGDTVTADGQVVPAKRQLAEEAKVIGGDNPTNITVEVRLPDSLNITTPAPIAEEFARYNRKWAPVNHTETPHSPRGVIVTCMDGRVFTETPLGLRQGETNVIRNAGGRAQDAVRSIVISQQMLGTNEIAIYHHTDCGLGAYDDEDIETKVTSAFGRKAEAWADKAWYTFKEDGLYQSLVSDVEYLKLHPLVNSTVISGWIYNVTDGLVQRVV